MPVTKSRANYPLSNEGQPQEPQFVRVVDAAGNDVQGSGAASQQVQGNVANAVADSGNPVKTGGVYRAAAVALTNGNRGDTALGQYARALIGHGKASASLDGRNTVLYLQGDHDNGESLNVAAAQGYVYNGATHDMARGDTNGVAVQPALSANFWQYAAAAGGIVSSIADVVLKAAGAAGVRNFLSSLTINHDTLSAATECVIKDGATIIWRGKLQTAATDVAGTIRFNPPLRGTAATALNFALLTSVTGGVFVNAQGYTGA